MTNGFTLRPATREDASALLTLIQALAGYEKLSHEVVATPSDLVDTLFGEKPGASVLLAELGADPGEAVGYALFFPTYSTFLGRPGIWLEDLFVQPEHRGRGLGRALLSRVAAQATALSPEARLEWSVLDWNAPALRFYERLGASAQVEWTTHRLIGPDLFALAQNPDRPIPSRL